MTAYVIQYENGKGQWHDIGIKLENKSLEYVREEALRRKVSMRAMGWTNRIRIIMRKTFEQEVK